MSLPQNIEVLLIIMGEKTGSFQEIHIQFSTHAHLIPIHSF
jgi:hypothetical protein